MLRLALNRVGACATQQPAIAIMSTRTYLQSPPKRPRSAFLIFQNSTATGSPSVVEHTQVASRDWKAMSPEQRKEWEDQAEKERAAYARERQEYEDRCPPRPKLINSPYAIFMSEKMNSGMSLNDASKMIKDLPEEALKDYESKMVDHNRKRQAELDAWLKEHHDAVQLAEEAKAKIPPLYRFDSFIKYAQQSTARSKFFEPLKEYRRELKAQHKADKAASSGKSKRSLPTLKVGDLPEGLLEEMKVNHELYVTAAKRRRHKMAVRGGFLHAL